MGRVRKGRVRRTPEQLRAAARDPHATPTDLARLAHSRRRDVRMILAARPDLPASAVDRLLIAKQWSVRAAMARRPDLSDAAAAQLLGDRSTVLLALAGNPSVPPRVADRLLSNFDDCVSGVAAGNPATSPELLTNYARGMARPPWVLRNIATNPSCPEPQREEILTWLAIGGAGSGDPHFDPVTCLGDPTDGTVAPFQWYRNQAARTARPDSSAMWRVRVHTADYVNPLPHARIMDLAIDESAPVRLSATRFPYAPALKLLIDDEDKGIATAAAARLAQVPRWKRDEPHHERRYTPTIVRVVIGALILFGISNVMNRENDSPTTSVTDAGISRVLSELDVTPPSTQPLPDTYVESPRIHPVLADGAVATPLPDRGFLRAGTPRDDGFPGNGSTVIEVHGGPGPSNLIIDGIDAVLPGRSPVTDARLVPLTVAPNSIRSILFVGPAHPTAFVLHVRTPAGPSTVLAPVPAP